MGYLIHAAGDMFGHTFINNFTGGEVELGVNAVKHIVLEGHVDKRLDKSALDSNFFQASIAGVGNYIYQNLVDARPGTILNERLLRDGGGGTEYSIPRIFSTLRAELITEITEDRAAADDCAWYDPTCSATILNLIADYKAIPKFKLSTKKHEDTRRHTKNCFFFVCLRVTSWIIIYLVWPKGT